MPRKTTAERFWEKVEVKEPHECWPWTATKAPDTGYGQFYDGARLVKPHRHVFELANGPIPEGKVIDHTCHNEAECRDVPCQHRACCNPAHLEAVTQSVNSIRGRTGDHQSEKTHCPANHPYSPENTIWGRGGRRRTCRTCNRVYQRRYNEKRKLRQAHGG
ncbi:HNH endonuclease [Arthrobacter phage Lymara]|uniref:HNH endonuclease n=1 Tax=Arthrobacter phage Lymara TaxID=2599828 RepID=A0A5J6TY66_9CAUD|nr:HNH endonuclease [Arthrobacter phage Lymara]QFG14899.1 HNH endonuclease [Arthrobacter phage Lymara]